MDTTGIGFWLTIGLLLFLIALYILYRRALISDVEWKMDIIQTILDSKHKNIQDQVPDIPQLDSLDGRLIIITAQNDNVFFAGEDIFEKADFIFKVK